MPSTPTDAPLFAPWRLPLAQLLDSAAPTGTFSHSFGMESAIVHDVIQDAASCFRWLRSYLMTTLTHNDALAMRLAAEDPRPTRLCALSAHLQAAVMAPEARRANAAIGRRMTQIASDNFPGPLIGAYALAIEASAVAPHPALAAIALGCDLGAPWPEVCGLYLHSCLTSLVQNAVRAIPLGQVTGQAVLSDLGGAVGEAVVRAAQADEADLGASSPLLDVLQCEHEHQVGRMFIS